MEKLTFGQSWKSMTALLRKCGRQILVLLLLILLPAAVIRVYSFQTLYGDYTVQYELLDKQSLNEAIFKGDLTAASEQYSRLFPEETEDASATDVVMEVVFFALSLALDVGVLYFGLRAYGGDLIPEEEKNRRLRRSALQMIVIGLFMTWVISNGQSLVVPMILHSAVLSHFSVIYGTGAWITSLISFSAALLFVTWLSVFLQFMAILCVSGRTRLTFSFGYAREILRGRLWREMTHLLPFAALSFLAPACLQAIAILYMSTPAIGLTLAVVSLVLEASMGALTWLFLIPDVFFMEKQSGIVEKIRAAMKERENEHDK